MVKPLKTWEKKALEKGRHPLPTSPRKHNQQTKLTKQTKKQQTKEQQTIEQQPTMYLGWTPINKPSTRIRRQLALEVSCSAQDNIPTNESQAKPETKSSKPRSRRCKWQWTAEDDALLRNLREEGVTFRAISSQYFPGPSIRTIYKRWALIKDAELPRASFDLHNTLHQTGEEATRAEQEEGK
ncbi:hypothetical protein BGZ63DRAFT_424955 [Mariannaea sp. PMI_226]|nr:hypothetical protein BGZ63DRAFT_424955 [Mariannaea sp. PMI_226]